MIAELLKINIVVMQQDREHLLDRLADMGVLHVEPVDPEQAVADEKLAVQMDLLDKALTALKAVEPHKTRPDLDCDTALSEVVEIVRAEAERDSRLNSLYRQLEQQRIWEGVHRADLDLLAEAGIELAFYLVKPDQVSEFKADQIFRLNEYASKEVVAVLGHATQIPQDAELINPPHLDNFEIRQQAQEIEQTRKQAAERLAQLAAFLEDLEQKRLELQDQINKSVVQRGGYHDEHLFAVQGWVLKSRCDQVAKELDQAGIKAGVRFLEPREDENPPTQIDYQSWARPIKGLFDILNTFPGYREIDLSSFFMIAMPLFAAMLIGDAGYGLIFALPTYIWYDKMVKGAGKESVELLRIIGLTAIVWGVLSANFFGVTPETFAVAGGYVNAQGLPDYAALKAGSGLGVMIAKFMMAVGLLWREDGEAARQLLIKISFLLGSVQLILAHVRKAIDMWPAKTAWSEVGWAIVLLGMLQVIWLLFFEAASIPLIMICLIVGLALVFWYTVLSPNPVKRVSLGLASSLLPLIGTFGDTMSYIRLMAVGMASYYIAVAFNSLAATLAGAAGWLVASPVVIFGHALNVILAMIAIFAHGVRLNMLEFSNNAGVQWAGYAFTPFARLSGRQ